MKKYLFIDAAYLNFRLKDWSNKYFDCQLIELDYQKFSDGYDKTFYYDALVADDKEHEYFLNQLRELSDFHVFTGKVKGENKKKRQKQVDIMLAVHALTNTIRGNMDAMTLLAGDEDFTPLVSALVQEGMNVTIWAASESLSKELKYSADRKQSLTPIEIWQNYSSANFKKMFPVPYIHNPSIVKLHTFQYEYPNTIQTETSSEITFIKAESSDSISVLYKNLKSNKPIQLTGERKYISRYLILLGENQDEMNRFFI